MCGYYLEKILEYQELKDSLENIVTAKLAELDIGSVNNAGEGSIDDGPMPLSMSLQWTTTTRPITGWTTNINITPVIPVTWGQGSPYNDKVKYNNGSGTALTGCVTTATAQLMAYWKYPSKVGGMTMDWIALTQSPSVYNWLPSSDKRRMCVAHLMSTIGSGIGTKYEKNECGANTINARNWLRKQGYKGGERKDYKYNRVLASLQKGCPVLARGNRRFYGEKILGWRMGYYTKGHSWLIDGCIERSRQVERKIAWVNNGQEKTISIKTYTETERLLYCNWGWNGSNNGWFPEGCFNTSRIVNLLLNTEASNSDTSKSIGKFQVEGDNGDSYNYKYNKEIFVNLKPSYPN